MTRQQKQQILDEVKAHKMLATSRLYAYFQGDEVIFSYFEPPRSVAKEFAVVKYGVIEQVIRCRRNWGRRLM